MCVTSPMPRCASTSAIPVSRSNANSTARPTRPGSGSTSEPGRAMKRFLTTVIGLGLLAGPAIAAELPRYQHVFVIVEENKDYDQILDPAAAPEIARLAKTYGNATRFYAE